MEGDKHGLEIKVVEMNEARKSDKLSFERLAQE